MSVQEILKKIGHWLSVGSDWTVEEVDLHYLTIVKYKPMKESSYIPLSPELRDSLKGLINIQNEDNECFCWYHIRHLKPQDKDLLTIKKIGQRIGQYLAIRL